MSRIIAALLSLVVLAAGAGLLQSRPTLPMPAAGDPGKVDALTADHADHAMLGHIAFSPVTIGGQHPALALAPVAVAPDCQRQGIGSSLIRWSLEQCRQLGHGAVIVLGGPAYYSRFGFAPASRFGIECPFSVPPEEFMVLEFGPGQTSRLRGLVRYRPEFDLVLPNDRNHAALRFRRSVDHQFGDPNTPNTARSALRLNRSIW